MIPWRATPADAATCAQLLIDFNREFETPVPGLEELERRLAGQLAGPHTVILLTGRPAVGIAVLVLRENVWSDGPVGVLDELYVRPDDRSRGVGAALLGACEAVVAAAGGPLVQINVDGGDTDARRFYERHGYRTVLDGETEPMLLYERDL